MFSVLDLCSPGGCDVFPDGESGLAFFPRRDLYLSMYPMMKKASAYD